MDLHCGVFEKAGPPLSARTAVNGASPRCAVNTGGGRSSPRVAAVNGASSQPRAVNRWRSTSHPRAAQRRTRRERETAAAAAAAAAATAAAAAAVCVFRRGEIAETNREILRDPPRSAETAREGQGAAAVHRRLFTARRCEQAHRGGGGGAARGADADCGGCGWGGGGERRRGEGGGVAWRRHKRWHHRRGERWCGEAAGQEGPTLGPTVVARL